MKHEPGHETQHDTSKIQKVWRKDMTYIENNILKNNFSFKSNKIVYVHKIKRSTWDGFYATFLKLKHKLIYLQWKLKISILCQWVSPKKHQ